MRKEDRSLDETVVSPSDMGRVTPPAFVQREDRSGRTMVRIAVDLVGVSDQDINNSASLSSGIHL